MAKTRPTPEAKAQETEPTAETVPIETAAFRAVEAPVIEGLIQKNTEAVKLKDDTKGVVDGYLARGTEAVYRGFALKWFKENKARLQGEGEFIQPGASEDTIIRTVMTKGEWGAMADLNNPEGNYKEERKKLDIASVLRTDLKKEQMPPETPFLLLRYLNKRIEDQREDIDGFRKRGGAEAMTMATSAENQLKEMLEARKDIAEKITGEDLAKSAEELMPEKIPGKKFKTKEKFVSEKTGEATAQEKATQEQALLKREYEAFSVLDDTRRKKWEKDHNVVVKLEMTKDEFLSRYSQETAGKSPEEKEQMWKDKNYNNFCDAITQSAEAADIEGQEFFALLAQGYKPQDAKVKGLGFGPFKKRLVISRGGGTKPEDFIYGKQRDSLIKTAEDKYTKNIADKIKTQLESKYDAERSEVMQRLMEAKIKQLSNDSAIVGGVEKVFQGAKERIMREYILERAKSSPKSKAEIEALQKELNEGGQAVDINGFLAEVMPAKVGDLPAGLTLKPWGTEAVNKLNRQRIKKYLSEEFGLKVDAVVINDAVTKEDYGAIYEKKTGLFDLLMKILRTGREKKKPGKKTKTK